MAHTPTLNGFVEGLAILLADDGVVTIEIPYVKDLIDDCEFDTIYHEHLCYFSCTAVDALLRRHGLFLNAVEHFPSLQGGTLRWHVGARPAPRLGARLPRSGAGAGADRARLLPGLRRQGRAHPRRPPRAPDLAAGRRQDDRGVRRGGEGLDARQLRGHRTGTRRLRRRPQRAQARALHARHAPADRRSEPAARADARLRAAARVELPRRDRQQQAEYLRRGGRFIVPVPTPRIA